MTVRSACRLAAGALALALAACGGGGSPPAGSAPPAVATAANQVPVSVMQEPAIANKRTINIPYVTVTVCDAAGNCQAVDHVVVDTGSYGLRILRSALNQLSLAPMTVSAPPGRLGECATFLGGYLWGSVARATVKIGGEQTTAPVPVQLIADPALPSAPSPSCTGTGTDIGSLDALGGNGILGVGHFVHDQGVYYSCSASSCTQLTSATGNVPVSEQVANPVASFATNNNGVILEMPPVPDAGAPTATGVLTFGVATQADNAIAGYSILAADAGGNFTAVLQGQTYGASFIDSGSNRTFATLSGVPLNRSGDYAPTAATTYPVTLRPNVGGGASIATGIRVKDSEQIDASFMAIGNIADPGTAAGPSGYVDLGMPYFYGRSIAILMSGRTSPQGTGPLYAIQGP